MGVGVQDWVACKYLGAPFWHSYRHTPTVIVSINFSRCPMLPRQHAPPTWARSTRWGNRRFSLNGNFKHSLRGGVVGGEGPERASRAWRGSGSSSASSCSPSLALGCPDCQVFGSRLPSSRSEVGYVRQLPKSRRELPGRGFYRVFAPCPSR